MTIDRNATHDNELEAKAARISRRIDERLALEYDMHAVDQLIVLRYILTTKLMQGEYAPAKAQQVIAQLAKVDAALRELGEVLDTVREEAKQAPTPMTLEESLELVQTAQTAHDATTE